MECVKNKVSVTRKNIWVGVPVETSQSIVPEDDGRGNGLRDLEEEEWRTVSSRSPS